MNGFELSVNLTRRELCLTPQEFGDHEVDLAAFTGILHLDIPESQNWTTEEVKARYTIYKSAQTDQLALADSTSVVASLTQCLERLEHVSTIGMRDYPPMDPSKKTSPFICLGMQTLRKQLLVNPCARLRGRAICPSTGRPLENNYMVPPDCFTLSGPLHQSLQACLQDLQDLDNCLGPADPDDNTDFLSHLATRAAPNLFVLRLSMWDQLHDLSSVPFTHLAQKIHFTRLSELHLHHVELTQPRFQLFLHTAAPTLQVLTLVAVSLNDPIPVLRRCSLEHHAAIFTVWRRFLDTL
ncbi:uncharacterized protein BO80DRAFT_480266 [Aspergillus ibericus CBS 121593]|uniref:Uncharacterized protein n=1 Tax=Aspergillus ibericus CBS 121593 TaxID=1448316 RepID=A0A395GS70_9EURO|nr:hypothetical protein BO80DRAFT_480266 [Aspergillus ibericus CBS 121593]RAK98222.1 hypothetical protein BO80DRAFT_480266 [Aspergillus ibericus CBS 121593]